ncbi:hypothetical protein WG66_015215 [Moniliophthora roreri]|nr:hypothetical protein WG66_015215 [Moniliophthora roreri]
MLSTSLTLFTKTITSESSVPNCSLETIIHNERMMTAPRWNQASVLILYRSITKGKGREVSEFPELYISKKYDIR